MDTQVEIGRIAIAHFAMVLFQSFVDKWLHSERPYYLTNARHMFLLPSFQIEKQRGSRAIVTARQKLLVSWPFTAPQYDGCAVLIARQTFRWSWL